MSLRSRALVALSAGALMAPTMIHAQETDIQALRREMLEMRRDYETRLKQMEDKLQAAAQPTPQPQAQQPPQAAPATSSSGSLLGAPPTDSGPAYAPVTSGFRTPRAATRGNSFNPAIGAVLQGTFSAQSVNPDRYRIPGFATEEEAQPAPRGFALGESELNFQSNIDQWLFGNLTVAVTPENEVELEEAFFQTTSLPHGFTFKGGRFFSGIGYMNEQHSHVWDFVDPALPYRAFFGTRYGDDGAQLRWLAPTDMFLELGAEAFRGDTFPAGGNAHHGVGTRSVFAHIGDDIGIESSWRAGLSYMIADARERLTNDDADSLNGRQKIGVFDFVYKWAPNGNPARRNFKFQSEVFTGKLDGEFNMMPFDQRQFGWYAQAVYQFMPRWRVGLRYDAVSARGALDSGDGFLFTELDDTGHSAYRSSAMIDYSTSEFGRFRFQYNNDHAGNTTDHQVFLQYVLSIGAHGAHRF